MFNKLDLSKQEIKIFYLNQIQGVFRKLFNSCFQYPERQFNRSYLKNLIQEYLTYRGYCIFGERRNLEKNLEQFSGKAKERFLDALNQKNINEFLLITDIYNDLFRLKKEINPKIVSSQTKKIKKFRFDEYRHLSKKYLDIVFIQEQIKAQASDLIDFFLIHGSYASKDFIKGWSDLDTMVVLNDEVFKEEQAFNRARRFFQKLSLVCYRFDLTAHHRFIFLTDFDLNYYPQSILPLVVYENCFNLSSKSNELNFMIRDDYFEKNQCLYAFLEYFGYIAKKPQVTFCQLKKQISMLLLMPSLLLQTKNIYVYKKHSFKLAKKEFPALDFGIIDEASEKRNKWRLPWYSFYLNKRLIMFCPIGLTDFFHRLILYPYTHFSVRDQQISSFLKKTKDFCKQAIKIVEEDNRDKF